MQKVNPITINDILYIQMSELCKFQPKDTNLSKSPCYIINKYKFTKNKDLFFFKNNDNSWISVDGSNKKHHKAFVLLSVVIKFKSLAKFINYGNNIINNKFVDNNDDNDDNNDNNDDNNYNSVKYPIIKLNNNEKFKDNNGTIFNVETRGFRKYDQIYFRVKHVALAFNIMDLRRTVSDKKSSYIQNIDYIYIDTSKGINTMFFTYTGLIRCLFVSRSKVVSNFIDWSMKILFAAQFGTDKQKDKLISNIKELFSFNIRS